MVDFLWFSCQVNIPCMDGMGMVKDVCIIYICKYIAWIFNVSMFTLESHPIALDNRSPFILNRWAYCYKYSSNIWAPQLQSNSFLGLHIITIKYINVTSFCKIWILKIKKRLYENIDSRLGYHPIINPPDSSMFPASQMGKKQRLPRTDWTKATQFYGAVLSWRKWTDQRMVESE